ncbi:YdeI/OmpD-associated family protein [Flaviaesturariibacter terrae]
MPNSLAQKLKIRAGDTLLALHAPAGFENALDPLPEDVRIVSKGKGARQVHWFVTTRLQLETELPRVLPLISGDVVCWVYYPKGTSGVQTDLSRDKGWDMLLAYTEFQWLSLISFDATWSAFGFRHKTAADEKRAAAPRERAIFDYIDPVKKEVRLPDDLAAAFKKEKAAATYFNSLSFSNRKEYVEWIVSAKRAETRQQRVAGSIERLGKGWKNPRNM